MIVLVKFQHILEKGLGVGPVLTNIHKSVEDLEDYHRGRVQAVLAEVPSASEIRGWVMDAGEFCGRPLRFPLDGETFTEFNKNAVIRFAYGLEPLDAEALAAVTKTFPPNTRFIRMAMILDESYAMYSADVIIHVP